MRITFDEIAPTLNLPCRMSRRTRFGFSGRALLTLFIAAMLHAQSFSSGSTGADGILNITAPGVTTFTATPVGGGNVYNFTTIQIAAGSTLKLSGAVFPGPLYFLAQDAVMVAGTIDLSGQSGSLPTTSAQRTVPTIPGAGGYGGGAAAFGSVAALPGLGPAGGTLNGLCFQREPGGGGFSGNQFLVPLVGGSGGSGSGGSGGAGGGALLIASSASISVTGTITANGGDATYNYGAGGGAGGAIRLVAPVITGTGTITASGGGAGGFCGTSGPNNPGANGIVRFEFFQNSFTGTTAGNVYTATPFNLFVPATTDQPSIVVTSIGGVAVPPNPTGSFTVPDVILNSGSPLTVNISASNIPLGTIPTVYFSTENFPDQTITANAGLAGTLASSTTTATVTLNPGYSIGYIVATWTQ